LIRKTRVSAPEAGPAAAAGLRLGGCAADIVEIAALRARSAELERLAGERGRPLPGFGRALAGVDQLTLCVRPGRYLLVSAPAAAGASAALWQRACAGCATAVDLSSGLAALHLAGPAAREVLARGCSLDLDPAAFAPGAAAATIIAQVSGILAAVSSGLLLLTPLSTAAHLRAWLGASAQPFGFMPRPDVTVAALLSGDQRA
jgi:heterotetrameric sarcosine oxidase gamma subunit